MARGLNLARRPFIDTRPVNVAAGVLAVAVAVLTTVAVQTVVRYFDGSRKTRSTIVSLKDEIARLEDSRKAAEARLQRYDLDEMRAAADDANLIARQRGFSWTRFLDRLEKTLPSDTRVAAVSLSGTGGSGAKWSAVPNESFWVELTLVSRDPNGLPKSIRAFYGSPWFDRPTPRLEESGDRRAPDGRRIQLGVVYRDAEAAR
jgi:hypothetical protein